VWPNWIDLIILTVVWATCYNGFGRGFLAELLNLIGAVAITVLTSNYAGAVSRSVGTWLPLPPAVTAVVVYWGFFLMLWYGARTVRQRVAEVIKWERFNWFIQGMGLVLGGLRGLWWAGFVLLVFSSSGYGFLQESVGKKSVLAPRLLSSFDVSLEQIRHRFPGARLRGATPVPPLRPITHGSPTPS
jgi:uncharacterized membrane protein required for colicin V production